MCFYSLRLHLILVFLILLIFFAILRCHLLREINGGQSLWILHHTVLLLDCYCYLKLVVLCADGFYVPMMTYDGGWIDFLLMLCTDSHAVSKRISSSV